MKKGKKRGCHTYIYDIMHSKMKSNKGKKIRETKAATGEREREEFMCYPK